MEVIARSGEALMLADGLAGAILYPDGDTHVGQLAVLMAHGQWRAADEPVPDYAPVDLAARLGEQRVKTGDLS